MTASIQVVFPLPIRDLEQEGWRKRKEEMVKQVRELLLVTLIQW